MELTRSESSRVTVCCSELGTALVQILHFLEGERLEETENNNRRLVHTSFLAWSQPRETSSSYRVLQVWELGGSMERISGGTWSRWHGSRFPPPARTREGDGGHLRLHRGSSGRRGQVPAKRNSHSLPSALAWPLPDRAPAARRCGRH